MDLPDFRRKICLNGRPLYSVRMELVWLYPPTLDGKRGAMCEIVTLLRREATLEGRPVSLVGHYKAYAWNWYGYTPYARWKERGYV